MGIATSTHVVQLKDRSQKGYTCVPLSVLISSLVLYSNIAVAPLNILDNAVVDHLQTLAILLIDHLCVFINNSIIEHI